MEIIVDLRRGEWREKNELFEEDFGSKVRWWEDLREEGFWMTKNFKKIKNENMKKNLIKFFRDQYQIKN